MNTRRSIEIGLAVSSIFVITAATQYAGRNARLGEALAQTTRESATIKSTWSIGLGSYLQDDPHRGLRISAAFSPDNDYFSVAGTPPSTVSLWRREGKYVIVDDKSQSRPTLMWTVKVNGATDAVVAPNGKAVIAFAAMDPTRPSITVVKGLHHEGYYPLKLDGAIWGATISGNGRYGAVVTGAHSLYVFNLDGYPRGIRYPLEGTGNSVSISNDGSFVASGTWDASGVSCMTTQGQPLWRYQDGGTDKPVVNRLFEAQIASSSPYVLGVSYANVRQSNATVYLWDKGGSGQPLWSHPLDVDDSNPKVKISADGSHVALVYSHKIMHGDQSIRVQQLMLLDRNNHSLWATPKGGPLMSPNLVAISPDGNTVTVTDGQRALYNFGADGRISAAKMDMNAMIDKTVTSNDGRYVLVYTDDNKLTLVEPV